MRARPLTCVAAALLVCFAAPDSPLAAQELRLSLGRGFSDFVELERPGSWGVQARLPVGEYLRIVGGYRGQSETGARAGNVRDHYWPTFDGCTDEGVAFESDVTQWEVGGGVSVPIGSDLRAEGSVVATRNTLEAGSRGAETGRFAGIVYPSGPIWAHALSAGVVWTPWLDGWLGLTGSVRYESLDFDGCRVQDVGGLFCDEESVTTLEFGVALSR